MPASKIKQCLAGLLDLLGWYGYQNRRTMRKNALILMYHRVLPAIDHSVAPVQAGMYVTPDSLGLQLSYLKSKYTIVSLQDLVQRLQAGQDISHCCVITFDDGWQDNYQHAFPLICELNLPVTIFLATGFIGTEKWFWPEELAWSISHICEVGKTTLLPATLLDILNCEGIKDRDVASYIDHTVEVVKQWDPVRREKLVGECCSYRQSVCKGKSERLLLNWDEVREMNDSGLVSFGSHTVSHELLDQIHGDELHFQLTESIEHLQREAANPEKLLAYPNGNFSREVVNMLSESGYIGAVTTERGFVQNSSPLFGLPRIAVHEDVSHTLNLFKWRLFIR